MDRLLAVKKVDSRMSDIIGEDLPILKEVKKFVVKSGGKRIRPVLHYYFTKILEYEGSEWVDVGAIGELIHAASLLHDDVVDEGHMRRGTPTINALHGNKTAVLAGDYLFACALNHIATLKDAVRLIPIFTRIIRMLSVGELLQMRWETDLDLTMDVYNRVMHGKTGSLFGAMTESAAVLAGFDDERANQYRELGEGFGRVFQLRDDYLDYFADEKEFGKSRYQDFERGVVTRPVILLRESLGSKREKELRILWEDEKLRKSEEGLQMITTLMDEFSIKERNAEEIKNDLDHMREFMNSHSSSQYRQSILDQLDKLSKGIG